MTDDERLTMEIIFGLHPETPAPEAIKENPHNWAAIRLGNKYLFTCPDCQMEIREIGYKAHWAKAHRQDYQVDYFKRLIKQRKP